jgi:hypothetical protein
MGRGQRLGVASPCVWVSLGWALISHGIGPAKGGDLMLMACACGVERPLVVNSRFSHMLCASCHKALRRVSAVCAAVFVRDPK